MKAMTDLTLAGLLAGLVLLGPSAGTAPQPASRDETRAVWVTRWAFKSPDDVVRLFADLERLGINTVFFQVRGSCDALYRSPLEPWSQALAGALGRDPGWDPLEIAIEQARSNGVALHAWVNIFPAWAVTDSGSLPPPAAPTHLILAHPEYLACDRSGNTMSFKKSEARDNYVFLSPSHRGVKEHIIRVLTDIARRYEIDGLHLDYIRYPDSSYSYDASTLAAYMKQTLREEVSFAEWRRRDLTEFVGEIASAVRRARPGLEVSAAVLQKVDDAKRGFFQDGVEWVRLGHIDFLAPMIYTVSPLSFEERLKAYADLAGADNLVVGLGPYMEGFTDSILVSELATARAYGVRGFAIFNSDYVLRYGETLGDCLE